MSISASLRPGRGTAARRFRGPLRGTFLHLAGPLITLLAATTHPVPSLAQPPPAPLSQVVAAAPRAGAEATAPTSAPATGVVPIPAPPAGLHAELTRLLRSYVTPGGVRYAAWKGAASDDQALEAYVRRLEAQDPAGWPRREALAYWINLYNAATLRLILDHYPVQGIKEIDAPWTAKRLTVAGRAYSLNDVENGVIRPQFKDPRIHFALNCGAIGCPPLRPAAYTADSLEHQMNENCRAALNSSRYLVIDGMKIRATRIFDWYREDFVDAMGVREFMSRYVPDNWARKLTDMSYKLHYLDYDWKLNAAP